MKPLLRRTSGSKERRTLPPCAQSPIFVEDENAAFSVVEEEKREIEAPEEADDFLKMDNEFLVWYWGTAARGYSEQDLWRIVDV